MSVTNVAPAGKRGNICVGNKVSATMCPRLPVPLVELFVTVICLVLSRSWVEGLEVCHVLL